MVKTNSIELWIADVNKGKANRLSDIEVNNTYGTPMVWSRDSKSVLIQSISFDRGPVPVKSTVPVGPIIEESIGNATPARTYQDLLKNSHDEDLFDYYFTSTTVEVEMNGDVKTGQTLVSIQ